MRRVITIILSIICLTLPLHADGVGEWVKKKHDFGTIKEEDGTVTCQMKMINTGDSAMRITGVRPTCGCTASSYTQNDIAPGDTATITLTYDPQGRPGRFEKEAIVSTNTSPRRSRVTIIGNVIGSPATINKQFPVSVGALKLETRIIMCGDILKGKSRTHFIGLYNQSEDTLKAEFSDVPKHLQVNLVPSLVPPGEQATITVTFHSDRINEWGLSNHSFTMETLPASGLSTNAVAGIGSIETSATIVENFLNMTEEEKTKAPTASLSTDRVIIEGMNRRQSSASGTFTITNDGKSPLLIRRIYSLDPKISISCKKNKVKPGKSVEVKISVNPSDIAGEILNTSLTVITNDPRKSRQEVRIVGEIQK